MNLLVSSPVMVPIAGAALSIVVGRWRNAQRVIGVAVLTGVLACAVALLVEASTASPAPCSSSAR